MSYQFLQVAPRANLITKTMFRHTNEMLAEELSARVRPARCQLMERLCKWQRSIVSSAFGVKEIQATESAQLIVGVAKALCNLKCPRERSTQLRSFVC